MFSRQGVLRLPFQQAERDRREVIVVEELLIPPGDYRVVAVAQDRMAAVLGTAVTDFTVQADSSALTEIFLLEETPEAVILERPTDEEAPEAEPQGEKRRARRKTIRPVPPVLSPEVAMVPQGVVQAGRTAHLSYGVCAPAPETGFEDSTSACRGMPACHLARTSPGGCARRRPEGRSEETAGSLRDAFPRSRSCRESPRRPRWTPPPPTVRRREPRLRLRRQHGMPRKPPTPDGMPRLL